MELPFRHRVLCRVFALEASATLLVRTSSLLRVVSSSFSVTHCVLSHLDRASFGIVASALIIVSFGLSLNAQHPHPLLSPLHPYPFPLPFFQSPFRLPSPLRSLGVVRSMWQAIAQLPIQRKPPQLVIAYHVDWTPSLLMQPTFILVLLPTAPLSMLRFPSQHVWAVIHSSLE